MTAVEPVVTFDLPHATESVRMTLRTDRGPFEGRKSQFRVLLLLQGLGGLLDEVDHLPHDPAMPDDQANLRSQLGLQVRDSCLAPALDSGCQIARPNVLDWGRRAECPAVGAVLAGKGASARPDLRR